MKPDDFRDWRRRMGWKREEAALRLGLSLTSVAFYENGERPDVLKGVPIPLVVSWACLAIEAGLENPWEGKKS